MLHETVSRGASFMRMQQIFMRVQQNLRSHHTAHHLVIVIITAVQAALIALLLEEEEGQNERMNKKKTWVRPWIKNRQKYGSFHTLHKELGLDQQAFKEYFRLDKTQFEVLLQKVYKHIIKRDTNMRECIKPEEMCSLTLRYLASGESFRSLEFQFRISRRAISRIIIDVTNAIINEFKCYLATPKTKDEWLRISKKFQARWNFPNGLGAVDGKHIVKREKSCLNE